MRNPRNAYSEGIFHITMRGIGRQRIFDDVADRRRFLKTLSAKLNSSDGILIYAWCLMDNHAHILADANSADLSKLMQRTGTSYAQYLNGRRGRVGKVFQNRFGTQPVESDEHLMAAIRYIHRNPLEAGAQTVFDSPWSSFREIAGETVGLEGAGIVDAPFVLERFGGNEPFIDFHLKPDEKDDFCTLQPKGPRIGDAEATDIARRHYGKDFADRIAAMPKEERDHALATLRSAGLSIRQIERLTGIGRNVVAKAKLERKR